MILKVFLGYLVLWIATNLTVLFSVALGVGDSFIVVSADDILHRSLAWAAAASPIFWGLSGCFYAMRFKNPGLVLNLTFALVAVVLSLYLLGQFFDKSFVVASIWTGVPYAVFIVPIAACFAWAMSPASFNQVWPTR